MAKRTGPVSRPNKSSKKSLAYDAVLSRQVAVRVDGIPQHVSAEEAFLIQLRSMSRKKDASASELLADAQDNRAAIFATRPRSITIRTIIVSPGNQNHSLQLLRMAKKFDARSNEAYMALEPWIVEAALERLGDKHLTPAEQRVVYNATRTPHKVRWPAWWIKMEE